MEWSLGTSFLTVTIVGQAAAVMELIFLPYNPNPSSGQDIFHGGTIELGKLFVELDVREESLPKGIDGGLLIAKRDGDLFSVKTSNAVTE